MSEVLIGIDAGTTTVSVVAFEATSRQTISTATVPHRAYYRHAGTEREQDLERVASAVSAAVSIVLDGVQGAEIIGIGVTGQMHGFVLCDDHGVPVSPFITWEDRRACDSPEPARGGAGRSGIQSEDAGSWLDEFLRVFEPVTGADEGIHHAAGFASVNLHVLNRTGAIPRDAARVSSIQDWIVARLTGGVELYTDPSCAHSTGLYLPSTGQWNHELIEALGLPSLAFPHVAPAGKPVGVVGARSFGFPDGVPVCVGIGDNQASFLSSIRDRNHGVLITVGTGSQVSAAIERFRVVPGLDTRPLDGSSFLLCGAPLCGGRAVAMLHEFFAQVGSELFDTEIDADELYERMFGIADGESSIKCRTTFAGTRVDPDKTGAIENIGSDGLRPGTLVRGFLGGIADELFAMFLDMDVHRDRIVATGNGVRRNRLLQTTLGERFSLPVSLCEFTEEAAVGAALIAGVGIGRYRTIEGVWIETG